MIVKPSLYNEFKDMRREISAGNSIPSYENEKKKSKKNSTQNNPYKAFMEKYSDFEHTVDSFSARDLMFYFRETARNAGIKYVIPNYCKDIAIFKKLLADYKPSEICLMIRFVYESDQVYFEKHRISPGLFTTRWVNTIYADATAWDAGRDYLPARGKFKKVIREYIEDNNKPGVGKWV